MSLRNNRKTLMHSGLYTVLLVAGILVLVSACTKPWGLSTAGTESSARDSSPGTRPLFDVSTYETGAIVPGQVCVINDDLENAREVDRVAESQGLVKKKRRVLEELNIVMTIFEVPHTKGVPQGIADLRDRFPSMVIDANHRYGLLDEGGGSDQTADPRRYGHHLVGWNEQAVQCAGEEVRIGMVDTPLDRGSPLLEQRRITTKSFLSENTLGAPGDHGTAIATMFVGGSSSAGGALLPDARLFAAEAFDLTGTGRVETTTWTIVRSLDWLMSQNVHVINLSLGGPSNALLSFAVARTLRHNIPIVAAAGNSGPGGRPAYPAAEQGVIAVTAIDAKMAPYYHATKGTYISLAAPGVDIWVPTGDTSGMYKSGTSFATPFATTAVAALRTVHPTWSPAQLAEELGTYAQDLGSEGKDEVFGWGLVQVPDSCQQQPPPAQT